MASSLKVNYLLNLTNTIAGMIFPLITFPYASRILEADGIGIINFFHSIISYLSLLTCLGIPLYATREIAKVKHDPSQISKKSAEILILHIGLTLLGYIIVGVLALTIPEIKENLAIFLVLSASLIFTAMGCDWYFRGTEDFKYITIRGLIFRIIYIPLLFVFVRTKNDLLIYSGLTVFVTVGNNCFNFYRISQVIKLKELKEALKQPFKHLKGSIKIFLLSASISLYIQMNILLLGFLSTTTNVGYYTAASRITLIIAGFITALQTTLLPRSSSLISQNNKNLFNLTISKVLDFIVCFSLPMSAGIIIMSPLIIKLFAGESYYPAVFTLKLLSLNIIFSIINNYLCSGILIPQGKEKLATYACLTGGIVNIIMNFILVPNLAQNGSAIAAIATELAVCVGMIGFGFKYIPIKLWKTSYIKYFIATGLMFLACYVLWNLSDFETYRLIVIPIAGVLTYIIFLNIMRDNFFTELQKSLLLKLKFKI